jgi:RNA recognition motif-containing protein
MTSYVYDGGLSSETTEQDLEAHFSPGGETVKNTTIVTGRKATPRGFGFVELGSDEEARAAIDRLNGSQLKGRTLKVHEAREPRSRWIGRGHAVGNTRGRW